MRLAIEQSARKAALQLPHRDQLLGGVHLQPKPILASIKIYEVEELVDCGRPAGRVLQPVLPPRRNARISRFAKRGGS